MTKKKVHHTKKKTAHRKMGSTGHKANLETTGMEILGLVGASILGAAIERSATKINPKIVSVVEMGVGYWAHTSEHALLRGAGYGLMGSGAISFAHQVKVINGIEEVINGLSFSSDKIDGVEEEHDMHGLSNSKNMSGMNNSNHMSGYGYESDVDVFKSVGR